MVPLYHILHTAHQASHITHDPSQKTQILRLETDDKIDLCTVIRYSLKFNFLSDKKKIAFGSSQTRKMHFHFYELSYLDFEINKMQDSVKGSFIWT